MFRPRSRPRFFGKVQAEHEGEHDDEDDFQERTTHVNITCNRKNPPDHGSSHR